MRPFITVPIEAVHMNSFYVGWTGQKMSHFIVNLFQCHCQQLIDTVAINMFIFFCLPLAIGKAYIDFSSDQATSFRLYFFKTTSIFVVITLRVSLTHPFG